MYDSCWMGFGGNILPSTRHHDEFSSSSTRPSKSLPTLLPSSALPLLTLLALPTEELIDPDLPPTLPRLSGLPGPLPHTPPPPLPLLPREREGKASSLRRSSTSPSPSPSRCRFRRNFPGPPRGLETPPPPPPSPLSLPLPLLLLAVPVSDDRPLRADEMLPLRFTSAEDIDDDDDDDSGGGRGAGRGGGSPPQICCKINTQEGGGVRVMYR